MKQLFCIAIGLLCALGTSQDSVKEVLDTYNDHSVEYMYGDQLAELTPAPLLLDTREKEEYDISHLKNAIHVGFRKVNISKIEKLTRDKNTTIVVYCSIGVRSERIGKQLIAKGYTAVYNLYGGIFEWVNNDKKVYNNNQETPKVHAYSKKWGAYLLKGTKVYD